MNTKDNIIVPTSGGKDSALCLALAIKHFKNVTAVFNDTGWEHPLTYQYLDYLSERFNITIHRTNESTLIEEIIKARNWPSGIARFCTKELKQRALIKWYEKNLFDGKTKYDIWFGIRTEESHARKKKYGKLDRTEHYEPNFIFPNTYKNKTAETLLIRFPILDLHSSQVYLWLKKLDVKLNPLYEQGDDRVGCYPCLISGPNIQKRNFATPFGQEQLKRIREVENKIGIKYEMRLTNEGACKLCQI